VLHLAAELVRTREMLKRVYAGCATHLAAEGSLADLAREIHAWTGTTGH
jgi:hypothetical protein